MCVFRTDAAHTRIKPVHLDTLPSPPVLETNPRESVRRKRRASFLAFTPSSTERAEKHLAGSPA